MSAGPRILLVKTSSMGDVIHNLPVVGDILRARPDAHIDWVCEPPYTALVRLHPGVRRAFGMPLRALKKRWYSPSAWRDFRSAKAALAGERYDLILDTQGLAKSAWIASFAAGPRAGYDAASAREPIAARQYDHTHAVSRALHAVVRNRQLAAAALGYALDGEPDYGLAAHPFPAPANIRKPFVIFLHATSRADKTWPVAQWILLGQTLQSRGLQIVLPWGTPAERTTSEAIAAGLASGSFFIPPALALPDMAALLAHAEAVVGVDTGLAHLAVALARPTVGIYCATEPGLTGLHGGTHAINLGGIGITPSVDEVLAALARAGGTG